MASTRLVLPVAVIVPEKMEEIKTFRYDQSLAMVTGLISNIVGTDETVGKNGR